MKEKQANKLKRTVGIATVLTDLSDDEVGLNTIRSLTSMMLRWDLIRSDR